VGNPASVKRKKTEKRRKKYEERLGPGAYLPKAEREAVNAAVEKHLAEKKAASEAAKKARAAAKKK
jgi:DNA-binding helix-hairpin-helix protein with protein kinase domain